MLNFLAELETNNHRDWYHAHKAERQAAGARFEELVRALMLRIGEFDPGVLPWSPGELTFKLVRDTRFSRDKSPYNPAFRAHMGAKGKLPVPVGYYLMIRPGDRSFLGGGLFADIFPDATRMVRDHIAANGPRWEEIIRDPAFAERFTVKGTALKKVPAGYDKDHPQAEFLKYKSWYLEYPVPDRLVADGDAFVEKAAELFRGMKPFNDFLNQGLAGFQMPAR